MRLRLGDSTGSASLPKSEFFQPFSGEGGFFLLGVVYENMLDLRAYRECYR